MPFPPQTSRKLALLCSTGSHHYGTVRLSCTCMSAVRFMAFADRFCSFEQDVQEISRFSYSLFLSVRGFSNYAGPDQSTRDYRGCRVAFLPYRNGVGVLIPTSFSKLNSPAHRYLC